VDSRHALAEVFGPVAVLLPFGVEAEAVQICNEVRPAATHTPAARLTARQSSGMLLASIFSRDRDTALRMGHQVCSPVFVDWGGLTVSD
jgi:acyl-CoA reductase-like NAD-dependent aldehyde dehydrogenase